MAAGTKRRVRMSDVAQVAGVSLATVSRALRFPESVSQELRGRIETAAQRLGYAPNRIAGSLAGAHSPLIGVIVPSLTNAFFATTLERMTVTLEAEGFQLLIGHHGYDLAREARIVSAFAGWNPAAIVVTGLDHSRETVAALSAADCPVVEMWDLDGHPLDALVGFSNTEAGRFAGRHMARAGYDRIAVVCSTPDKDPRAAARARGVLEAHAEATGGRGKAALISVDGRELGCGALGLDKALTEVPDLRAIAFSGDMLAVGALFEADRRGIRVPEDLALVGYGDLDIASNTNPPLTTVRPPRGEIGTAVAEHILKRLKDPDRSGEIVTLNVEMVVRDSG
ncbi:LacI family DNA-binding transcriptional regulator [Tropicimonas sp. IMCC6043]|uniref:LacI family DNA-binding transcriptional regulator n=1 Tax=Tropicimonas sp. IMCC6043 TaxID=2510645 RepID=UPI00101CE351|nr:LacI family DNA-binding transcriptional regulator [Tropicimonas sp. IMCC6043]RYH12290.1 LacI family DNA-binding transcriptional regulator [Tropicimonas sp. IMCC6043]